LFGDVADGVMRLNQMGHIVRQCWLAIPDHVPPVLLDEFVVMPNHVHGIIVLVSTDTVGAIHPHDRADHNVNPLDLSSDRSNPPPPNASTNIAAHPARRYGNAIILNTSSAMTNR
jgi:hypothetical protein